MENVTTSRCRTMMFSKETINAVFKILEENKIKDFKALFVNYCLSPIPENKHLKSTPEQRKEIVERAKKLIGELEMED